MKGAVMSLPSGILTAEDTISMLLSESDPSLGLRSCSDSDTCRALVLLGLTSDTLLLLVEEDGSSFLNRLVVGALSFFDLLLLLLSSLLFEEVVVFDVRLRSRFFEVVVLLAPLLDDTRMALLGATITESSPESSFSDRLP